MIRKHLWIHFEYKGVLNLLSSKASIPKKKIIISNLISLIKKGSHQFQLLKKVH